MHSMAAGEYRTDSAESFADALRQAITDRGLALSRLRDRLAAQGHRISVATLSYWQSGRSQPERAVSLEALATLEQILQVPAASLRSRLDAPRPRGRQVAAASMDTAEIVQGWHELEDQARRNRAACRRMSVHLLMVVAADRTATISARAVSRVHADWADRVSVYLGPSSSATRPPQIVPLRGCTLGPVHTGPGGDAIIAEMVLPEPMSRGTSFTVEYELRPHQAETTANILVETYRTSHSLVGVTFDPNALPRELWLVEKDASGEPTTTPLTLRPDHSALLSRQDFGPGRLGIEWAW